MHQSNRSVHGDDELEYIMINPSSSCDATTSKTPMVTFTDSKPFYLKGNHLAVRISEDEYLKGVDECKNSMRMMIGRLVHPKGVDPLTVEDLKSKLQAVGPPIVWNVSSLGKGFYCFRFNSSEDLNSVQTAGSIFLKPNGVLHLREWTTDFNPNSMTQSWVRIFGVGLEYWREKTLFQIASAVGTPIEVDVATLNRTYCEFARVLVEVDLSNSVRDEVLVERDGFSFMAYFKFEELPSFCSYCKSVGHSLGECKHQPVDQQPERIPSQLNPRSSDQDQRQQHQTPKVQEQQPPPKKHQPVAEIQKQPETNPSPLNHQSSDQNQRQQHQITKVQQQPPIGPIPYLQLNNHMTNTSQYIYGPRGLGIHGDGVSGPLGGMSGLGSRRLIRPRQARSPVMENQTNMLGGAQSGNPGFSATGQMLGQGYPTPMHTHQAYNYSAPSMQTPYAYNDSINTTLYVGNLDINVSEEELRRTFLPFGEVVSVMVPAGKGCGFVEFGTRASAEEAIKRVQGTMIGQQIVRISWGRLPGTNQQQQQQFYQQPYPMWQVPPPHQQIGSPFQGVVSSPLVGSLSLPQQMSKQMQKFGPQKINNQQSAIDPLLLSVLTPQVNNVAANTIATPASPQLSSQTSDSSSFSTE